jgi:glycosyltransferase involved in cell wall biosynthesis
LRLGVYVDLVFRRDGAGLSADRAFVDFITGLAPSLEELVFFGRLHPRAGRAPHALPSDGVRLAALPFYHGAASPGDVMKSVRGSLEAAEQELDALDAVWLFGPHPLALALARAAHAHGKPIFLGVRQNLPRYAAARFSGARRLWALPAAFALELAFRRLARHVPSVVVGEELARKYAGGAPTLATGFSLVRDADLVPADFALARPWEGELRLLSVGRLSPEKNPLLLLEIIARLRDVEPRWRLSIAGEGPLAHSLSAQAGASGLGGALELLGYIPSGPALWERYRSSHAFLHVSRTEGLPQVIFEAQAAGLPVVATDVGGVRAALGDGSSGLIVSPFDAGAAATAVDRLRTDPELRRRLVEAGARNAASETQEKQLARVLRFFRANLT